MSGLFSIPMLQFRYQSMIVYYEQCYTHNRSSHYKKFLAQRFEKNKAYSGSLSAGAKKRMCRAVNLLLMNANLQQFINPITHKKQNFRLAYITLTIPIESRNITPEEAYKKVFKHFLQWLVRTKKISIYLWKAEQQKRGQLHYHITITSFVHYQEIKDKWNNLLSAVGWLDEYREKHKKEFPNSTDIHTVYKPCDLENYLIKEFVKSIQNFKNTCGKLWDCSLSLKQTSYYKTEFTEVHEKKLLQYAKTNKVTEVSNEHCVILKASPKYLSHMLTDDGMQLYKLHMHNLQSSLSTESGAN
jgi:glycosyltransferase involved in cell wall biosynthesis